MTTFPDSPKLIKGGLVLIDADTARVLRIISLQYNADTLTRKLQAQEAGGESGNRVEPTRFRGPAVETISLEADIDAPDQPAFPDQSPNAGKALSRGDRGDETRRAEHRSAGGTLGRATGRIAVVAGRAGRAVAGRIVRGGRS